MIGEIVQHRNYEQYYFIKDKDVSNRTTLQYIVIDQNKQLTCFYFYDIKVLSLKRQLELYYEHFAEFCVMPEHLKKSNLIEKI